MSVLVTLLLTAAGSSAWAPGECSAGAEGDGTTLGRGVSFSNCAWLCSNMGGVERCCSYDEGLLECSAAVGGVVVPTSGTSVAIIYMQPTHTPSLQSPSPQPPPGVLYLTTATVGAFTLSSTHIFSVTSSVTVTLHNGGTLVCPDPLTVVPTTSPATYLLTLNTTTTTTITCNSGVTFTPLDPTIQLTTPSPQLGEPTSVLPPRWDWVTLGLAYDVHLDGVAVVVNATAGFAELPVVGTGLHVVVVRVKQVGGDPVWADSIVFSVGLPNDARLVEVVGSVSGSQSASHRLRTYTDAMRLIESEGDIQTMVAAIDKTVPLMEPSDFASQKLLFDLVHYLVNAPIVADALSSGFAFSGEHVAAFSATHDRSFAYFAAASASTPLTTLPPAAGRTSIYLHRLRGNAPTAFLPYSLIPDYLLHPTPCTLVWMQYLPEVGVWAPDADTTIRFPHSTVERNLHIETDYTEAGVRCAGTATLRRSGTAMSEGEEEMEVAAPEEDGWFALGHPVGSGGTSWKGLATHGGEEHRATGSGLVMVVLLTLGLVYILLGVSAVLYDLLEDKKLTARYELVGEDEKNAIALRRAAAGIGSSGLTNVCTHTHDTSLHSVPSEVCIRCIQAAASVSRIAVEVESHEGTDTEQQSGDRVASIATRSKLGGAAPAAASSPLLSVTHSTLITFARSHIITSIFTRIPGGTQSTAARLTIFFGFVFAVSLEALFVFGDGEATGMHPVALGAALGLISVPVPALLRALLQPAKASESGADPDATQLYVRVVETTDISTEAVRLPDAYAVLRLGGSRWRSNPCFEDATPNWGPYEEAFLTPGGGPGARNILEVKVAHNEVDLCESLIDVGDILNGDVEGVAGWYPLTKCTTQGAASVVSPRASSSARQTAKDKRFPSEYQQSAVRLVLERRGPKAAEPTPRFPLAPFVLAAGIGAAAAISPSDHGVEAALATTLLLTYPYYRHYKGWHDYLYSQVPGVLLFIIGYWEYSLTFLWAAVGIVLFGSTGLGCVVLYKDNVMSKHVVLLCLALGWGVYLLLLGVLQGELQRPMEPSLTRSEVLVYPGAALAFCAVQLGFPRKVVSRLAAVCGVNSLLFASLAFAFAWTTSWEKESDTDYLVTLSVAIAFEALFYEPIRILTS